MYDAKCWDGAYYLAGYAVECALKACIAKATPRYDFPAKERVNSSHTHNLPTLVRIADIESSRKTQYDADLDFRKYSDVTQKWSEQSRYTRIRRELADELLIAVSDRRHGIIPWIKRHW